ncbi:response regulator [Vibrio sp. ZSDZ65]|uniref:Response regulator n=1 Tax=Vibrio qingdaonensis TaxID=2829491 RepID=A0A9X3HUQ1_9VIBR|nr:response regulator [Vibrio qingdaonensis]MCW8344423.1 response regulator [Vibrio qingdaonensis]
MKPKYQIYTFPVIKLGILALMILTSVGIWLGARFYLSAPNKQDFETPLIQQSKVLTQQLEATVISLDVCIQGSNCDEAKSSLNGLMSALNEFKSLASSDKSQLSLVGAVEYSQLELAVLRFLAKEDHLPNDYQQLREALSRDYVEIRNRFDDLFYVEHERVVNELRSSIDTMFLLSPFIALIAIFVVLGGWYRLKKTARNRRSINDSFLSLSNRLDTLDSNQVDSILNNVSLDPIERNIYSKLRTVFEKVDRQQQDADLNQQLYGLIGYEIRGITSTIKGGIQYLVQDSEDSRAVLAKDITSAADTLSDLAENYNRLLSQGRDKSSSSFSFLDVLSELTVHLKSKLHRESRLIECDFNSNLPLHVVGHQTSLFWILFLKLSSAMQIQNDKHVLFRVTSESAENVDKTRITLSITFLTHLNVDQRKIDSLHWSERNETTTSNDEWTLSILNNISYFDSHWYESGQQRRYELELDIEAQDFQTSKSQQLKQRHIVVCSQGKLALDLLSTQLTSHGAQVTLCNDPNELFRITSDSSDVDAIIISDLIEGIQIESFSKTLGARLKAAKTKLFLLATHAEDVHGAFEYVDKVFFTPALPHEFIPNLTEALEAESVEETLENSSFLIVEDDKVQQFLLKRILMKQEYQADTVGDGSDAVDWVRNQRADIIFMDCIMPGMGGIEATKLIRKHESDSNLTTPSTIIGATALTSVAEHKACIEAGMDYVISKPYKSDEIIKVIKKYVAFQKLN